MDFEKLGFSYCFCLSIRRVFIELCLSRRHEFTLPEMSPLIQIEDINLQVEWYFCTL